MTTRLANHWGVTAVVVALVLGTLASQEGNSPDETELQPPSCSGPVVALTFDDGPSRGHSRQLADILDRNNVRATMFMSGRAVAERPGRARRFARDGHVIHNHTYDHVDLTETPDEGIRQQITATRRALDRAGIDDGRVVRPPYGRVNPRVRGVLRDMGYRAIRWTVDTNDWDASESPADIHRAVVDGLEPRATILLHDKEDSGATMRALPRIIRSVRQRGYCFGVVNDRGRVVRARS